MMCNAISFEKRDIWLHIQTEEHMPSHIIGISYEQLIAPFFV